MASIVTGKGSFTVTDATAASPDLTKGVELNGTNQYYTTASDLIGIADGGEGAISLWLKTTAKGNRLLINDITGTARFITGVDANGKFFVTGKTSGGVDVVALATTTAVDDGEWHHVFASWSTASGGADYVHMYLDGVSDKTEVITPKTGDEAIDYTGTGWAVGATASGALDYAGCIAELWFDDSGFDLDVGGNDITDFYSATGPVSLGTTGQTPTGSTPLVYLSGGASQFATNNFGTGGDFAKTGTPIDCTVDYTEATNITAKVATVSLAGVKATLQADVDTNITAKVATVSLAGVKATLQADVDTNITAKVATIALPAVKATLQADVDTNITAKVATVSLAGVKATVVTGTNITAKVATISLPAVKATLQADVDTNITAKVATISLPAVKATLQADVDTNITAKVATVSLAGVKATVNLGTNITAKVATVSLAGVKATLQADVDTNITAKVATIALPAVATTIQADVDTNITAKTATVSLAAVKSTVDLSAATNITAKVATVSLAGVKATLVAPISAKVATVNLTAFAGTVNYTLAGWTEQTESSDIWTEQTENSDTWIAA